MPYIKPPLVFACVGNVSLDAAHAGFPAGGYAFTGSLAVLNALQRANDFPNVAGYFARIY
jgi:hypothetical protein